MDPKQFCSRLGFSLETESLDTNRVVVHLLDSNRLIYKSGRRDGQIPVAHKGITAHIARAYDRLQDLILEQVFT